MKAKLINSGDINGRNKKVYMAKRMLLRGAYRTDT